MTKAKACGLQFQAWEHDGKGFLMGAAKDAPSCGCTITGNGSLQHPLTIVLCKKHESAVNEFDALKEVEKRAHAYAMADKCNAEFARIQLCLALAALDKVRNGGVK